MAKIEDLEKLVASTLDAFGRIDILVNNAGINPMAPTLEFPADKWDRVMAVNVRAPFFLCQKVAKIMKGQGGGKIINIASVNGLKGSPEETHPNIAYNTSKGALINMTKDLAIKLAGSNIQVNAIAVGYFRTDMTAKLDLDEFKALKERLIKGIPLGRSGGEEDIKGVALLLASAASDYVSGAIIPVDGGLSAQ
jgi:gluconate 5-dehydrogenase